MKFDSYSNQMVEKGLDAAWLKMRVAANNVSNYSTPGYKSREVSFVQKLQECKSPLHGGERVRDQFQALISQDERTEARVDGNNVSLEKEQLEQWRSYAQYSYLVQKANSYYSTLRGAISQFGK